MNVLTTFRPKYETDELALGVALAFALHAIPVAIIVLRAMFPAPPEDEKPLVEKPVIAATLLKLGKPIDPRRLPDRIVPRARTAPKHDIVAARDDPMKKHPDAGAPPPPNTQESDITRLIAKSDPFAEDAGKARPELGSAQGVQQGTETDPSKVHAGDMYAATLSKFFHDRHQIPTVISEGEARKLCVQFQINIDRRMKIFHLKTTPIHSSANDLFDDSARSMLQKLLDTDTPLPEPPPEVAEQYRGRTVVIAIGESSRCK